MKMAPPRLGAAVRYVAAWGLLASVTAGPGQAQVAPSIVGAWSAETYHLKDGPTHPVQGRIFFADADWQVLFFVMDEDGRPRRGSAEGGGYTLAGDSLVLTHLFNLSVGDAMEGLAAAELRMVARGEEGAPEEPTRVDVSASRLVLHFPSGNRMVFRRRP